MYKIYAQIGFGTNRQTFNKNIATAEKSPIFTSHKSYTKPLPLITRQKIFRIIKIIDYDNTKIYWSFNKIYL
jgi:hypothetical protein